MEFNLQAASAAVVAPSGVQVYLVSSTFPLLMSKCRIFLLCRNASPRAICNATCTYGKQDLNCCWNDSLCRTFRLTQSTWTQTSTRIHRLRRTAHKKAHHSIIVKARLRHPATHPLPPPIPRHRSMVDVVKEIAPLLHTMESRGQLTQVVFQGWLGAKARPSNACYWPLSIIPALV